jgi:hypothetical protein
MLQHGSGEIRGAGIVGEAGWTDMSDRGVTNVDQPIEQ